MKLMRNITKIISIYLLINFIESLKLKSLSELRTVELTNQPQNQPGDVNTSIMESVEISKIYLK